jgi:hypothetical protein
VRRTDHVGSRYPAGRPVDAWLLRRQAGRLYDREGEPRRTSLSRRSSCISERPSSDQRADDTNERLENIVSFSASRPLPCGRSPGKSRCMANRIDVTTAGTHPQDSFSTYRRPQASPALRRLSAARHLQCYRAFWMEFRPLSGAANHTIYFRLHRTKAATPIDVRAGEHSRADILSRERNSAASKRSKRRFGEVFSG